MSENEKPKEAGDTHVDTGGGTYVDGGVQAGGDFVGRDQIVHGDQVQGDKVTVEIVLNLFAEKNIQGDYVDRRTIADQVLALGPEGLEAISRWLAEQQGLGRWTLTQPGGPAAPPEVSRQIEEVSAAQKEATARGVPLTPQAAYQLGLLAAYRRDYEGALDYFRQATVADPFYADAFGAIAWLQQSRAMDDIQRRDYEAAVGKLAEARTAATHTDPLDARALSLRGYIAKTLAQIAELRGDAAGREQFYAEAARFFEHVVQQDPEDASAQNGLGNVQYALGHLDAAIDAYCRAIELKPAYSAAHHDLAAAYEAKRKEDPARSAEWCRKALAAWREAYELAPNDRGFSADQVLWIGQRIAWLKRQCE
jgi:tetratricopeptide (TPR) repeat protein